jgi:lipid II:glycine glycyltransferase (peptidoglycan interpeptide bridge formation enzyme)
MMTAMVSMSPSTTDLNAAWDNFVKEQNGHLLQTSRWGQLKAVVAGWGYEVNVVMRRGQITAGALVLFRRLPFELGTIAYVPRGPVIDWSDTGTLETLLLQLDFVARKHRAILLKVEPDQLGTPAMRERLDSLGFHPSPHSIQPECSILVDISGSEEDILARMSQSTRRKVRTGPKKGLVVRRGDAGDLASFNTLMAVTGERDSFGVHSPAYYQAAYELFTPGDHVALLIASYEGRDLAGVMAFAYGNTAWYLYGASSNEERQRMPNYGLQWEAIRWARERGCMTYDLWGIPDENEELLEAHFRERDDGLWGVYGFKRGFGGQVVRTVGAWDRVYRPVLWSAYKTAYAHRSRIHRLLARDNEPVFY